MKSPKRHTLLLFVFPVLLGFALRIIDLPTLPAGLHPDEAQQMIRQWRFAEGYGYPMYYEGAPEPFDPMMRAVVGQFVGISIFTMRWYSVMLNVFAVATTIGACRVLFWRHPQRDVITFVAGIIVTIIPATLIIGREIYRANALIPMTTFSLWALAWAWRTLKLKYAMVTGIIAGWGAILYLAGPFLPIAILTVILLAWLIKRQGFYLRQFILTATPIGLFAIPWFYLYLNVPNWLSTRLQDFGEGGEASSAINLGVYLDQFWRELSLIFLPNDYFVPNYNTQDVAFLNPVLVLFFVVGLLVGMYQSIIKRDKFILALLLVWLAMMLPPALTSQPEEAIRSVGVFAPLAILTAYGLGVIINLIVRRTGKTIVYTLVAGLMLFTIGFSVMHINAHWEKMHSRERIYDGLTFLLIRDQIEFIRQAETPLYVPMEYLNFRTVAAYLRPTHYPNVRAYAGESLPDGDILALYDSWYGTPLVNQPQGYVLLLPDEDTMVILPPMNPADRQTIEIQVIAHGETLVDVNGTELLHHLPVSADNNPITEAMLYQDLSDAEPLAVFEENLELLDAIVPDDIRFDEWNPIILYWRLRDETATDYSAMIQFWNPNQVSYGRQFEQFNPIFFDIAPTPMWQAGEVYAEMRFVKIFEDVPEGGYWWMLNVHKQPNDFRNPTPVAWNYRAPVRQADDYLMIGRSFVGEPSTVNLSTEAQVLDATFDETIRLSAIGTQTTDNTMTIQLAWEVLAPPIDDVSMFIHLRDEAGEIITQYDGRPLEGYPTHTWQAGMTFTTEHTLELNDSTAPPESIALGLYRFISETQIERLSVLQDGETVLDDMLILR